jgi:glycosyltransferase involved in cell wall biosynthesis
VFLGAKVGSDLAAIYASSDVFVFPSRTDTYGIVLLEALASGQPIAAFPAPGPRDVIGTAKGVSSLRISGRPQWPP